MPSGRHIDSRYDGIFSLVACDRTNELPTLSSILNSFHDTSDENESYSIYITIQSQFTEGKEVKVGVSEVEGWSVGGGDNDGTTDDDGCAVGDGIDGI